MYVRGTASSHDVWAMRSNYFVDFNTRTVPYTDFNIILYTIVYEEEKIRFSYKFFIFSHEIKTTIYPRPVPPQAGLGPAWGGTGLGWYRPGVVPAWGGTGLGWYRPGVVPAWGGTGLLLTTNS